MISCRIIKINRKNAFAIAKLVSKTYRVFNKNDADKESLKHYLAQFDFSADKGCSLVDNFKRLKVNIGAFSGTELVGVIRGSNSRVINLFVAKDFHHHGIGGRLLNLFERQAVENQVECIKVRSSSYAVGFYSGFGYKKTTGQRSFRGLKVQPMKKILN